MRKFSILILSVLLVAPFQNIQVAFADSSKSWRYSNPYVASEFTINQKNDLSGEFFSQGFSTLVIRLSKIAPKFLDVVDELEEIDDSGSLVSPNPRYIKVYPDYVAESGALFTLRAYFQISDNPDFNQEKSKTYQYVMVTLPMGPAGNLLLTHGIAGASIQNLDDKNWVDVDLKTFLKSTEGGLQFEFPDFEIKSSGPLYVSITMDLSERWRGSNPLYNVQGGTHLAFKTISTSVIVTKKSQVISSSVPSSVPLKNRITRIQYSSSSGLTVIAREADSSICVVDRDLVHFINAGDCQINLSQVGNESFEPASDVNLNINVTPLPLSIICVKGKLTKKVTAIKPSCPKGYKIK